MPRQRARGLMWLTLAHDSAAPDETWIKENYNKAIAKASENDRAMALEMSSMGAGTRTETLPAPLARLARSILTFRLFNRWRCSARRSVVTSDSCRACQFPAQFGCRRILSTQVVDARL